MTIFRFRSVGAFGCIALAASAPMHAQDTTATRVAAGVSITLADAIRIALTQNSSVRVSRNAVALDSLTVRQFRNQFLPSLSASSQSSQGFGNGSSGRNSLASSAGLSTGIILYNGRQNVNSLHEAELNLQASGHDLTRVRQTIVFTVATDFLNLITQQEQLRVGNENLAAQTQELRQLEAFTTAGTHPIGDLYQQQAAVAATRLAVANASHAAELAKVDLIQELLLDPRGTFTFVPPAPRDTTLVPVSFNLDSLITLAIAQRAEVQAQLLRVEAAKREILVAGGGRLPVVSATGGYSSGFNSGASGAIGSQIDQQRGGSVGIGVSFPILDRGAVSLAKQRAQLQLENETLALRDVEQSVALDVRRAYLDYEVAGEQLTESNQQQRAAALALQAAQARYADGVSTFIEVALARATLIQAQSAVVNARSSLAFQRTLMSYYTGVLGPGNARLER
ncbi:MAG: TolC family protein [Gemmatimonadaceae bacterium]